MDNGKSTLNTTYSMTTEQYRAHEAANYSWLKYFLVSAAHAKAMKTVAVEETLAMKLGNAVDGWILTGSVRPYAIMPEDIATATGKGSRTAKQAWKATQEAAGLTCYKQEEWDTQSAMQRALESSPEFQSLLSICPERQKPVFAKYRGIEMKILIDLCGNDGHGRVLGDLKTARDASPRGFGKNAFTLHYDLQLAAYSTVLGIAEDLGERPALFWAVVESSPAAPVSIFRVPAEALESGQRKLDRCCDLYLQCMETGIWPAYGPPGFLTPIWPRYADEATRWAEIPTETEEE